jgi:16S rRNA (uracil1498-N3)-methyltransferase
MKMRRYWIDKKDLFGDKINFAGDTFHHIFDVCRQETGSKFEVLTEDSKAYLVEVTQVGKKNAEARVLEQRTIPPLPRPHLHLVLAISRFPVMDAVVEKAVEMGVTSIQPVFTDFSFVRTPQALSANKTERWDKIVRSATQQCGRGDLMRIEPARHLGDFLKNLNRNANSVGLFAYEGPSTLGIKQFLTETRTGAKAPSTQLGTSTLGASTAAESNVSSAAQGPSDVWIFVGSEGGFSDQEVRALRDLALHPVTLGAQVLRVETACMALVSVLKYEFDLMC